MRVKKQQRDENTRKFLSDLLIEEINLHSNLILILIEDKNNLNINSEKKCQNIQS